MRVTITCEECGERHRLERRVSEPGPIWIVCHNCELPLQAVLDGDADKAAPLDPPPEKDMERRFQPPLSWSTTRVCRPAGSWMVSVTVAQVCQPPVAGTFSAPVRSLPEVSAMWNASETPLAAATLKLTV